MPKTQLLVIERESGCECDLELIGPGRPCFRCDVAGDYGYAPDREDCPHGSKVRLLGPPDAAAMLGLRAVQMVQAADLCLDQANYLYREGTKESARSWEADAKDFANAARLIREGKVPQVVVLTKQVRELFRKAAIACMTRGGRSEAGSDVQAEWFARAFALRALAGKGE